MSIINMGHPHFDTIGSLEHTPVNHVTYQSKATGQFVNVRSDRSGQYIATPAMYDGSPLPVHAEPLAWGESTFDVLDAVHAQR